MGIATRSFTPLGSSKLRGDSMQDSQSGWSRLKRGCINIFCGSSSGFSAGPQPKFQPRTQDILLANGTSLARDIHCRLKASRAARRRVTALAGVAAVAVVLALVCPPLVKSDNTSEESATAKNWHAPKELSDMNQALAEKLDTEDWDTTTWNTGIVHANYETASVVPEEDEPDSSQQTPSQVKSNGIVYFPKTFHPPNSPAALIGAIELVPDLRHIRRSAQNEEE